MTLGLPVSGEKSKKLINGSQHVCKIYRKPCMFVGKRVQKPFQWHLARQGETPEVHTISIRTLSDAGAHFHIGYKSITRVLQGILAFVTCSFESLCFDPTQQHHFQLKKDAKALVLFDVSGTMASTTGL